ncbi:type II 3-dehydroquinate dehydratase [Marivirga sp. S37H4]|uniref:3-dehydroquinate dehydratase n=1 Tax=Marivirga aurantiaca TaxID=2802615 RepID=A0A934WV94_9BACT|nr:type II 3-dehydroquinate dehydratase [Marivirga aurantiaca]MBK6263673.1 type II 3-dehydroquinate dehydratase [Marivirga aurantiaca]
MRIIIINGPNLNLLGKREPEIYGASSFEEYYHALKQKNNDVNLAYFQSNIEGELVDTIQQADEQFDGILLNAAAYTHTSIAIHDAIGAINTPVIEIHVSNIYKREEFRHKSIISSKCVGLIAGLGLKGYQLGIDYFKDR